MGRSVGIGVGIVVLSLAIPLTAVPRENNRALKAEGWFINVYFPLWNDTSTLDLAAVAEHYRDPYFEHSIGRFEATTFPTCEFSKLVTKEIDRGWLGDDLEKLESSMVNETTASLNVRVVSRMRDGSSENFCFWYLVENSEGRWLITNVIEKSCE